MRVGGRGCEWVGVRASGWVCEWVGVFVDGGRGVKKLTVCKL